MIDDFDFALQKKSHSNPSDDVSGSVQHRKASGDSFAVPPGDPRDHHLQPEHQVHPSKWSDLLKKFFFPTTLSALPR